MILVTLGTQDKKFYRLLEALEDKINQHLIKDEVIVQAGCSSDFKSKSMKIFDLIPMDEFDDMIKKCDILITHGGVGSIITGLKNNKKVIAAARLSKYNEHVNDHQIQLLTSFEKEGYLIYMHDLSDIKPYLEKVKSFEPKMYQSNQEYFVNEIKNWIDSH